jgi:hypothetical protein
VQGFLQSVQGFLQGVQGFLQGVRGLLQRLFPYCSACSLIARHVSFIAARAATQHALQ